MSSWPVSCDVQDREKREIAHLKYSRPFLSTEVQCKEFLSRFLHPLESTVTGIVGSFITFLFLT